MNKIVRCPVCGTQYGGELFGQPRKQKCLCGNDLTQVYEELDLLLLEADEIDTRKSILAGTHN